MAVRRCLYCRLFLCHCCPCLLTMTVRRCLYCRLFLCHCCPCRLSMAVRLLPCCRLSMAVRRCPCCRQTVCFLCRRTADFLLCLYYRTVCFLYYPAPVLFQGLR